MDSYKYVIIGGGLAGGRAGDGIRSADTEGTIALVTEEHHMPYQRPPLSKGYLMGKDGLDDVRLREDSHYAENRIDVLTGTRAVKVKSGEHSVALDDGRVLGYEKLLLATGGRAWVLPIPGNDLPGVFTLRTVEDSDSIRQAAGRGNQALVLGGSFMGSEIASSLAQLGLSVTMTFLEERLLARVAPDELSDFLRTKYEAAGVRLKPRTGVESLEGEGGVERVVLSDHQTLEVDLVVMGVGIRLNTELAREAGLTLGDRGAVIVDEFLRTSDPDIYAAGDIASWPDPTFGKRLQVEHWDVARLQGRRAGRNMAGDERPYRSLPYFYSDLFDFGYEVWGNLETWDKTVLRGSIADGSFALYYFDQGIMVGVLAAGRPGKERRPMQALVRARPELEAVAAKLADEASDLATLV
jgi:NADPH-dependent 2,4-dienoyl-CoA reductase/sulfur reductase-like enzyme